MMYVCMYICMCDVVLYFLLNTADIIINKFILYKEKKKEKKTNSREDIREDTGYTYVNVVYMFKKYKNIKYTLD